MASHPLHLTGMSPLLLPLTPLPCSYLHNNFLSSSLPSTLGGLSALVDLVVGNNRQLNGSIPDSLGSISTLERLVLSENSLQGTIPNTFSQLTNLEQLSVPSLPPAPATTLTCNFHHPCPPRAP
ncbi:unnamed protein product [Closterium sp. Naga37s-1]|nr:unnamed protein product [Closterium sp. Naga37s-1]